MTLLPTFVVIGAMKCGTTSLWSYLRAHPDVFMADPKEPNFFCEADFQSRIAEYKQLFASATVTQARGEASTSYTKAPLIEGVAPRMASVIPDVKIIYLVRHPIERIRSHYVFDRRETRPLAMAIRDRPEYVDLTRYAYQVDHYLQHFSREQMLVVSAERLRDDRAETLRSVYEFIGVTTDLQPPDVDRELYLAKEKPRLLRPLQFVRQALARMSLLDQVPVRYKRSLRRVGSRSLRPDELEISAAFEAELWERLDPDLQRLREIVGPDFDLWGRA